MPNEGKEAWIMRSRRNKMPYLPQTGTEEKFIEEVLAKSYVHSELKCQNISRVHQFQFHFKHNDLNMPGSSLA